MPWLVAAEAKKALGLKSSATSIYRNLQRQRGKGKGAPMLFWVDEAVKENYKTWSTETRMNNDTSVAEAKSEERVPALNYCPCCGVRLKGMLLE